MSVEIGEIGIDGRVIGCKEGEKGVLRAGPSLCHMSTENGRANYYYYHLLVTNVINYFHIKVEDPLLHNETVK